MNPLQFELLRAAEARLPRGICLDLGGLCRDALGDAAGPEREPGPITRLATAVAALFGGAARRGGATCDVVE